MPISSQQWRVATGLINACHVPRQAKPSSSSRKYLSRGTLFLRACVAVLQALLILALDTDWWGPWVGAVCGHRVREPVEKVVAHLHGNGSEGQSSVRFYVAALRRLLIIAGDVEQNPGPPKPRAVPLTLANIVGICDILKESGFRVSDWQNLASRLRFSDPGSIKGSHEGPALCLEETIRQWLHKETPAPTWEKLANEVSMVEGYGAGTEQTILRLAMRGGLRPTLPQLLEEFGSDLSHLDTSGLSHEQEIVLKGRLIDESQEIMLKFQNLVTTIQKSLAGRISVEKLASRLCSLGAFASVMKGPQTPILNDCLPQIRTATDMESAFWILRDYFSFFNYRIIEYIAMTFGSESDQLELQAYKEAFVIYCKRRCVECPVPLSSATPVGQTKLVVKLDLHFQTYRLEELHAFTYRLSQILGVSELVPHLCGKVIEGSILLTFQIPVFVKQEIFPLSSEQMKALQAEKVVELTCDEHRYMYMLSSEEILAQASEERRKLQATLEEQENQLNWERQRREEVEQQFKKKVDEMQLHIDELWEREKLAGQLQSSQANGEATLTVRETQEQLSPPKKRDHKATQATGEATTTTTEIQVQTDTEPTFLQTSEEIVKEDWKEHKVWINKDCFFKCWSKIWQWIDVGALTGQLMKHGLVNGHQDFFLIDATKGPRGRADNLLYELTERAGEYGYYMLYMCIRDCEENRNGHSNVVKKLKAYAEKNHIQPPQELTGDDRRPPDGPSAQLRQQSGGASGAGPQTRRYSSQCTQTPPPLGPQYTSESVHYSPSVPTQLSLLPSDPTHKPLSKELEDKFLPSIQKLREKGNIEREIETHRRHHRVVNRMHEGLQTSEEAQVLKEILQEKKQKIGKLQLKLTKKEPGFKQAEDNMKKLRAELDESREPIIKKKFTGVWRIASTEGGKLLATVIDGKGSVALLERQGDTLLELEELMIHRNDTCEWTPAGIAVDGHDIFIGDAAGAVPPGRTREQLITANTDISNQGESKLRRFKLLQGEHDRYRGVQVPDEQPLQVGDPSGMAFSRDKLLYVCDRSKHQVTILDHTNECTTLSHYGKKGTGEGQFRRPTAIAFDDNGDIYVLDQGNRRVQVFSPDFRFLRSFGSDVLIYPAYDIHVSKEFVYVTQTELNCVLVFDKQYGIFVVSFSNKMLKHPVGIVADKEGYIYVCGASNVWVF